MRFPIRPRGLRSVATRPPGPGAQDRGLGPGGRGQAEAAPVHARSIGCGSSRRRSAARGAGEVGRLLRREGLYSSHLTAWRKARRKGSLRELASKKRGAKPAERNPLDAKVRALEAQVARLEHELHTAHTILDVQGKVAGLLGLNLERGTRS